MEDVVHHFAAIQQYISDMKAQLAQKEAWISNLKIEITKKDEICRKLLYTARFRDAESTKSKEEAAKWKDEASKANEKVAESNEKVEKLKETEQMMKDDLLKVQKEKELVEMKNVALEQQVKDQLEKISTLENQTHLLMEERADVLKAQEEKELVKTENLALRKQVKDLLENISTLENQNHVQGEQVAEVAGPTRKKIKRSNSPAAHGKRGARKRLTPDEGHAEDPNKVMDGYFFCKCGSVYLSRDKLNGHLNRANKRILVCKFCDERCSFGDFNWFCDHLQKKHNVRLDGQTQTGCFVCGKILRTREEYVAHYQANHYPAESELNCRAHPAEIFLVRRE